MPFLTFLLPVWQGGAALFSSLLSTEFGRLVLAVATALVVGFFAGTHSAHVKADRKALEARIEAQARDIRVANEVAELAQSQARDADKARADALSAIEEIKAHASRNCLLSPDDVGRLRRAGH
jgi:hypothetical protein